MKGKYYMFSERWIPQCVTLDIVPPSYDCNDALDIANYHDFWYEKGTRWCTYLQCPTTILLGQPFKDLYEAEGWTGLAFSEPIKFHKLKPGLVPPFNYYKVDVLVSCEKVIAEQVVITKREDYPDHVKKTGLTVINDYGSTFFYTRGIGAYVCQAYARDKMVKAKFSNIDLEDFYDWFVSETGTENIGNVVFQ